MLYRRHSPALYGLALRLAAGSGDDARDIVQDAWLRAVARLGDFASRSSLRTWLSGFVVNCWRERTRAATRRQADQLEEASARHDPPPVGARVDLERALARLAPGGREVVLLHDVEGYTHAEIAAWLGIEESTSRSQLTRARRALRALLEPPGGNGVHPDDADTA